MKTKTTLKNLFTVSAILVCFNTLIAQTVNYKIVENDPDRKNLFVHINPFNVQCYMAAITIGYNVQATYLLNNRFQAEIDYRKAYLDANADGIFATKGLKKAYQLQIGCALNFSNKLKDVSNKVVLKSSSGGGYTYTSSISVIAKARKIKALRGGFINFFNNYKIGNDITSSFSNHDIKGKDKNGNIDYLRDDINFETINYTANSMGLYAGIDAKSIRDVVVETDGYGTKSTKLVNNFYLDLLFTPVVIYTLKPNAHQAMLNDYTINISQNSRKIVGWRFGWQYIFNRTVGFNAKMEIGQQPGVPDKSFFMALGFGLTIGSKISLPKK